MRIATEVALRIVDAGGEDREPHGQVLLDGQPLGAPIAGRVLEAAVQCEPGYLLFVTDDVPEEEMLRVCLIARDGAVLDSARIGGAYTTGMFRGLRLEGPAQVHFQFIDEADWWVEVFNSPHSALPWWPDAKGVWRGTRLSRHFRVHRSPA